jgi:hypothetical protein
MKTSLTKQGLKDKYVFERPKKRCNAMVVTLNEVVVLGGWLKSEVAALADTMGMVPATAISGGGGDAHEGACGAEGEAKVHPENVNGVAEKDKERNAKVEAEKSRSNGKSAHLSKTEKWVGLPEFAHELDIPYVVGVKDKVNDVTAATTTDPFVSHIKTWYASFLSKAIRERSWEYDQVDVSGKRYVDIVALVRGAAIEWVRDEVVSAIVFPSLPFTSFPAGLPSSLSVLFSEY